jgi:hypothetical protein
LVDIFNEVDEEVRREQLKKLWDRYGLYIVALALVVIAAFGGWRGYQYLEAKKAAEAGAKFEAAVTLSEAGKHAEAEAAFAKIASEAPAGYAMLARLRSAAELSQTDAKAAVAAYDKLAADTSISQTMRDVAALRAGLLLVDTAPFSDLKARLEPLAEPDRAFRHTARELLALSAWRSNDAAAAQRYIDMTTADAQTPPGTRSRLDVLSALLGANGKG